MAIDHGSKHIGLAISDPSGTIANPLKIVNHVSRAVDVAAIADIAKTNGVQMIVIGQSFGEGGQPSYQGRCAARFAEALKSELALPIVLWDEAFTTIDARLSRIKMNARRKKRKGHLDSLAATILLQDYLDENLRN